MLIFYLLVQSAQAWWCNGHMTVAMVAQLDLQANHPEIYSTAQEILAPMSGALTHGVANTFVESACWPDVIKQYNFNEFTNAHFIDRPYNPQGMMNASGAEENVVFAINNLVVTLKAQTVQTAPLETSMCLRFLIHFLGDIHQPLHCVSLWNKVFPSGDQGGNLFPIQFTEDITELHALWDSCIGVYDNDLSLPLNDSSWDVLQIWAQSAMNNYTREDLKNELMVTDFNKISIESFMLAKAYAYEGIQMGGTPSQEYLETRWAVVQRQLALAGYRLSDLLYRTLSKQVSLND
jgi:hypothetical protein